MKFIPASVAALALIASGAALSLPTPSSEGSSKAAFAVPSADLMVGGYLDSLESLVGADPSKAIAVAKELRAQCLRVAVSDSLKADLSASVGHLLARLGEAHFDRADIDLLRLEIVHASLSEGIDVLSKAAATQEWSEKELHAALMGWLGKTTLFREAPDSVAYRASVAASLELAMLQATGTVAASQSLTVEMLRMRLAIAIRRYQLAYERGNLTAVELDRLVRIAVIRVRRIVEENY